MCTITVSELSITCNRVTVFANYLKTYTPMRPVTTQYTDIISASLFSVSTLDTGLSPRPSVGLSACLSVWKKVLWQNGFVDPAAVWGGEWGWSRHGGIGVLEILFPIALGAWIGIFTPNAQYMETFIAWKLLHVFQPNFERQYKDQQICFVSDPETWQTNLRWRMADGRIFGVWLTSGSGTPT